LEFVDRRKDGPFFLYLALTIPHANNEAGKKGMEVPDLGQYGDKDWPEAQKGTAAMISWMDRDIGRLMKRLKDHGIDERTIVMFSSDNGPHAEGGNDPNFFDSNGPLRGTKRDLYDGGIRVPMLVRWPGRTPRGTTSGHIGSFADLLATAADLAGVKAPPSDGISFLPAAMGKDADQPKHDSLYWEFYERGSAQAVRMGRFKGVRKPMFTGPIELYDVTKDLGETSNVAAKHPEVVKKIEAAMREAHRPSPLWKVPGKRVKAKAK